MLDVGRREVGEDFRKDLLVLGGRERGGNLIRKGNKVEDRS